MSLAAVFLLAQAASPVIAIEERGFCTGLAWIEVTGDAAAYTVDEGPDFSVYRYDGSQTDWWGIYSGNWSQVSKGKKKALIRRDGLTVSAVTLDGEFRGYYVRDDRGLENHFFGSPFTNSVADKAFFDRVDFGPEGRAKCARHPAR